MSYSFEYLMAGVDSWVCTRARGNKVTEVPGFSRASFSPTRERERVTVRARDSPVQLETKRVGGESPSDGWHPSLAGFVDSQSGKGQCSAPGFYFASTLSLSCYIVTTTIQFLLVSRALRFYSLTTPIMTTTIAESRGRSCFCSEQRRANYMISYNVMRVPGGQDENERAQDEGKSLMGRRAASGRRGSPRYSGVFVELRGGPFLVSSLMSLSPFCFCLFTSFTPGPTFAGNHRSSYSRKETKKVGRSLAGYLLFLYSSL